MAELVSVKLRVSAESTAASFVPRMLIVTEVVVPSAAVTVNESVYVIPTWNSSCAELRDTSEPPLALTEKAP